MIVYSDRRLLIEPRPRLVALAQNLDGPCPDLAAALIEAGVLEAAVADALLPEEDAERPVLRRFRAAMLDLARAARGERGAAASARERLAELAAGGLPDLAEASEPEGFAFYALYPETYAEAARRFRRAVRPEAALVVGVRSIGTTLSAVVADALAAEGVTVRSVTVRPRGHPWDRRLRLSAGLREAFAAAEQVLVVDEGPGISGTSFAAVAEAALEAGVPEGRIHVFPSWDSDGSGLRSERARAVWPRVRRWTVRFEELFLGTGRLASAWGGGALRDLSGGLWREVAYPSWPGKDRWPAVQPQHERRKYLLEREDGTRLLLKFVGLGERGPRMLARGALQAGAGLAPPVIGLRDGFLAQEWLDATPVHAATTFSAARVERRHGHETNSWNVAIGKYLGFLAAEPVGSVRFDEILAMTRLNVAEGLGEDWAGRLGWMEGRRVAVESRPAVAVDGRILPQEWLWTKEGRVLKSDGLDHHDDHFWPSTQDIAWDVAGAMVEWGMDTGARRMLLHRFKFRTGFRDKDVDEVLPFYEAAYLAWRLGYTTLAAETLGETEDGRRMARDRDVYAGLLRAALERGGA